MKYYITVTFYESVHCRPYHDVGQAETYYWDDQFFHITRGNEHYIYPTKDIAHYQIVGQENDS